MDITNGKGNQQHTINKNGGGIPGVVLEREAIHRAIARWRASLLSIVSIVSIVLVAISSLKTMCSAPSSHRLVRFESHPDEV